jgi:hypothetical protein
MTKYRPHRGQLSDSLAEIAEVEDFADLVRHMQATCPGFYPNDERPTIENTEVVPYLYDDRIGWDTHMVTVKCNAWGFTDGPLPE